MTATIHTTPLPAPIQTKLTDAHTATHSPTPTEAQHGRERLAALLWAGRARGWTWQALGDQLGVNTSRVHAIAHRYGSEQAPAQDVNFPRYRRERIVAGRVQQSTTRELNAVERRELAGLAALAKAARGVVAEEDPRRVASQKLSKRLADLHADGVPWRALAQATSTSEAGVRRRVVRHGLTRTVSPSIPGGSPT